MQCLPIKERESCMLHNYFKAKELIQKILLILKCTTTSCSFKLLPNVRQKQEKYNTEKENHREFHGKIQDGPENGND